jgi:predicted aspartyl protease
VIPCTVQQGNTRSNLKALVDTGATGIGYIHRDLARNLNLRQTLLPYVIYPTGFTGTVLDGGEVSHTVTLRLQHDNHVEIIRLYVTNTGRHEIILGQPWMNKHRVNLDYANEKLLFTARRCTERCLRVSRTSAPTPQGQ